MNRYLSLSLMLLLSYSSVAPWKGAEAKGEQPIFMGVLTSQEGNVFNVTNISVGRSRDSREKIMLYEMPKNIKEKAKGDMLSINPAEDLTTSQLELLKIKKIEVPNVHAVWKWKDQDGKRMSKEYIEIVVTWKNGSPVQYLLELGPVKTNRPVKIFSEVIDKPIQGVRQDGTLFCPGLKKDQLRTKGAPFTSVKSLALDEPCYKVPTNNGGNVQNNNKDS